MHIALDVSDRSDFDPANHRVIGRLLLRGDRIVAEAADASQAKRMKHLANYLNTEETLQIPIDLRAELGRPLTGIDSVTMRIDGRLFFHLLPTLGGGWGRTYEPVEFFLSWRHA